MVRTAPEKAVDIVQQVSPEQSISHQLKRLIVSLLAGVYDIRANDMPGGASNLSKRYGHRTLRYEVILPLR